MELLGQRDGFNSWSPWQVAYCMLRKVDIGVCALQLTQVLVAMASHQLLKFRLGLRVAWLEKGQELPGAEKTDAS